MRILVVASDLPAPPTWGAAIRNYQFISRLGTRHQVWLLTYSGRRQDERVTDLEDAGITVRTVPWSAPPKRLTQLGSVFSLRSHAGAMLYRPAMQSAIDRLLIEARPHVVLVEGSLLGCFRFGEGEGFPIVLDEHNVEYELLRRTWQTEHSPIRKAFGYLEYRKFRREERSAWRRAAWVVCTSERECAIVRAEGGFARASSVPNGVDPDQLRPSTEPPETNRLVFTGRMDYRPNTDAVVYFVRAVLPLIHRRRPDVIFTVVGAGPPPAVQQLAGPRVEVTGPVPDVRPYWRRAAVAVVPIRFGGGTRLKVVEALAMGRPVVSTSLGCEGIDVVPGEHLLVADSPPRFADAVVRVLSDPELGGALGRRGRALVEARYGWPALAQQLEAVLREVATDRHTVPLTAATG